MTFRIKNTLLFLIIIGLSTYVKAGNIASDSTMIDSLLNNSIGLCYKNPAAAITQIEELIIASKANKSKYLIAKSHNVKGIYYDIVNEWDSAIAQYEKTILISEKYNQIKIKASALNNIGLVCWNKNEYELAISYYLKSLQIFESIGNKKGEASNLNNIGLILFDQKQLKNALRYHQQALKIRKEIGDDYGSGASYSNIGMVYAELKKIDSSLYFYRKSILIKRKIKDIRGEAFSLNNMAISFKKDDNNLDSAEIYILKAIELHKKINNRKSISSSLDLLGKIYLQQKKYKKATKALLEGEELTINNETPVELSNIYNTLAKLYNEVKDYEKATLYYKKYISLITVINDTQKDKQFLEIQKKYESEKKEKENIVLRNKANIQAISLTSEENKSKFLYTLLILLVIVATFIILYLKSKQKAKIQAQKLIEEQLKAVAIIKAEEKERIRIAKDLHDGIGQILSSVKMNVSCLEDAIPQEDLDIYNNSIQLIDEAVNEVRSISHNMMPPTLLKNGLISAIEALAKKINTAHQLQLNFGYHKIEQPNPDIAISLYRIIQEIINNMIKHAAAKTINIQLSQHQQEIIVSISDDGKGFDTAIIKNSTGIGWKNIFSRISAINGKIEINSIIGKGSSIAINIPV